MSYEACKEKLVLYGDELYEKCASSCEHFKSKNKFIEKPCEILDNLYLYTHDKLFELCVQEIEIHVDYFNKVRTKIGCVFSVENSIRKVYYSGYDIGIIIFKTPEEAKRAAIGDDSK